MNQFYADLFWGPGPALILSHAAGGYVGTIRGAGSTRPGLGWGWARRAGHASRAWGGWQRARSSVRLAGSAPVVVGYRADEAMWRCHVLVFLQMTLAFAVLVCSVHGDWIRRDQTTATPTGTQAFYILFSDQ